MTNTTDRQKINPPMMPLFHLASNRNHHLHLKSWKVDNRLGVSAVEVVYG